MKSEYKKAREDLIFNVFGGLFGLALVAVVIFLLTAGVGK